MILQAALQAALQAIRQANSSGNRSERSSVSSAGGSLVSFSPTSSAISSTELRSFLRGLFSGVNRNCRHIQLGLGCLFCLFRPFRLFRLFRPPQTLLAPQSPLFLMTLQTLGAELPGLAGTGFWRGDIWQSVSLTLCVRCMKLIGGAANNRARRPLGSSANSIASRSIVFRKILVDRKA